MGKVIISTLSVSVGQEYLQEGGSEWNEFQRLKYYGHFIPSVVQMKNAIAFACGDLLTDGISTGAD